MTAEAHRRFRTLDVFVVLDVGTRRMVHLQCYGAPPAEWTVQHSVHLSRFWEVRYCNVRHGDFLIGQGAANAVGDG
jgi:hypothetical protein